MNLQEILTSFELSDDQITQINQAVDGVIEGKLAGKADEIKALEDNLTKTQGDLDSANDELTPVRDAAQKDKLASLMPETANPDLHADIVALAGITDEDDDETIKSKLEDTLSSRDYLQKGSTDDKSVAKVTEDKTDKTPEAKDSQEEEQEMPQGVK